MKIAKSNPEEQKEPTAPLVGVGGCFFDSASGWEKSAGKLPMENPLGIRERQGRNRGVSYP
jgi:hypothetical protein